MKNSKEMADEIFRMRDSYFENKRKQRLFIGKQIAYICSAACITGLAVFGFKNNLFPKPQFPEVQIAESTENNEESCQTTVQAFTTTETAVNTDIRTTTAKITETTAKTTTAAITTDNSAVQTAQTTAVSSAVQSTAVNTSETVTTTVHTENTTALQTTVSASTVQSSINTTYVNTNASPLITTINTNNAPIIETSITDCSPYQSTTITTNITQTIITTVTTDIPFGALFEFNGITYMHKGESIDKQMLSEKIGEYNGISIYSVKKYISEIQIAIDMNEDYYYIFDNITQTSQIKIIEQTTKNR